MTQHLMHHILTNCMLDVIFLGLTIPLGIKLMNLYSDLLQLLYIKSFINLAKASSTE
jgi:hypothetical protein